MTHDPNHPGAVAESGVSGVAAGRIVRAVLAVVFGAGAAALVGAAWVLAVGGVVLTSPEQPVRLVSVLLTIPELRHDIAADMVDDLEETTGRSYPAEQRAALEGVLDDALVSPGVQEALATSMFADERLDVGPFAEALAEEVGSSSSPTLPPEVLAELAAAIPAAAADASEDDGEQLDAVGQLDTGGQTPLRDVALAIAGGIVVAALFPLAICLALARRRRRALAIVGSGSLILAAMALAPGEHLLAVLSGPWETIGRIVALVGTFAGPGTVWTLLLAALVPWGLWWWRRSMRIDTETGVTGNVVVPVSAGPVGLAASSPRSAGSGEIGRLATSPGQALRTPGCVRAVTMALFVASMVLTGVVVLAVIL